MSDFFLGLITGLALGAVAVMLVHNATAMAWERDAVNYGYGHMVVVEGTRTAEFRWLGPAEVRAPEVAK